MTWADLVSFHPTPATLTTEPAQWGIAGADTNFLTTATPETLTDTLLGRPATVRFTPTTYTWDYGDGDTHTTTHPGAPWHTTHTRDFDPTPTSHTYRTRGTYTPTLTITYTAAYTFNGPPYHPVPGTLTLPTTTHPLRIYTETTVLVSGPCTPSSTAPGC